MLSAGISLVRKPQKLYRTERHLVMSYVDALSYIKKPDR
jgi:hypothetical protein